MYRFISRLHQQRRQEERQQSSQPRLQRQSQPPHFNPLLMHNRGLRFQRRLQPPLQPPPPTPPRQPIPTPTPTPLHQDTTFNHEPILSFTLNETNFHVYEQVMQDLEEEILRHSRIYANATHGKYKTYRKEIKNDRCPILLTPFEDDSSIFLFLPCNHAIDSSTMDEFVEHFHKCPLCNADLS